MLGQRRQMLGLIAAREDTAVHGGVQRLHTTIEHLRYAGQLLDPGDRHATFAQGTLRIPR